MRRLAQQILLLLGACAHAGVRNVLQTWGSAESGQTAHGTLADSWTPRTVRQLQGTAPIQIAFGYQHGLALSFAQEVYSWGCATWGALGRVYNFTQFGVDETYMPTPQLVFDLQGYRVREVYAGGWHSAVRLENGNVMTWGFNKYGQLGHGTYETEWTPRVVHELVSRAPQTVALGRYHSGAVDYQGDLWMWGSNAYGQCGLGNNTPAAPTPRLLDKMQGAGVLQLAFGCGHSLALLRNGSVLAWGRNERRQLGLGPKAPAAVPFPVEVRLLREEEIVQVATSCVGSVAVHRNGSLLFWGANDDGQAAIGRTKDIHTPIVPPVFQPNEQGGDGVRFEDVALGRRHTLAMVRKTHEVYAWGFGERGSLGLGDASNRTSPMLVKDVDRLGVRLARLEPPHSSSLRLLLN